MRTTRMADQTHSMAIDGARHVWSVPRLWALAADLPVEDVRVSTFDAVFDLDCWFGDRHAPTVGRVLDHMARIQAADLGFPIILSADGVVMDGLHRLCKARLAGHDTVRAVRFDPTPAPDRIEPPSAA
jgi:hypothetical protein